MQAITPTMGLLGPQFRLPYNDYGDNSDDDSDGDGDVDDGYDDDGDGDDDDQIHDDVTYCRAPSGAPTTCAVAASAG